MRDVEVPGWLKELQLAPVFRPTDTEFADPIAYIAKIEKEASQFGICKIIPPLPKPSRKYVFNNLNRSLSKFSYPNPPCSSNKPEVMTGRMENNGNTQAVFTTRHQQLGNLDKEIEGSGKPENPVFQMQVWESGELYTIERFESKSKMFGRDTLGKVKDISPLVVETMFWESLSDVPIYVEYANDVPGSGFGEPNSSFHVLCGRRNKGFNQGHRLKKESGRSKLDTKKYPCHDIINDTPNSSQSSSLTCSPSGLEISHDSEKKSFDASDYMVGTAGWKLSNCPWNLRIISRSLGSLTRFMPDNIPGVTSPMVYIGMLFSWFAWHVEDHELHSLNFLHTGAPKTWYAIPGEYAFAFEQVIRSQVYGGNLDHLAALALLGKKTTLLSPEVIMRSRIPCYRLVQYPGEFVVTFPRAYHVGFSHGFNCGEAANFCTPEWLNIAKEAAVRRAAMGYLPMLSHQQLLYVLTTSMISRIPRSLFAGPRSSRLRDRQTSERELSVKKAFIEDFLTENNFISVLLQRDAAYRAVIWNPQLLPSFIEESSLCHAISSAASDMENISNISSENCANVSKFFDQSDKNASNEMYLNDNNSFFDREVDSGPLTCVACGVLGFPFMSILQPYEIAFEPLLYSVEDSSSVSAAKISSEWTSSSAYFRPRIFCMEHSVEVERLLQSKGGVRVLVICHSDFFKIKAHASAVAEEVGRDIEFHDTVFDVASQADLNLINLAVDEESQCEYIDWSSELGFNFRYRISMRKKYPLKKLKHSLILKGLSAPTMVDCGLKWRSKRLRSKLFKRLWKNIPDTPCKCESKLIQYSRRKHSLRGNSTDLFGHEETGNGVVNWRIERKRGVDQIRGNLLNNTGFVKSPCEGLRPRKQTSFSVLNGEASVS